MEMKARMLLQPLLHILMLVSAVIINNQMKIQILRSFPVNLLEKPQPLNMGVFQFGYGRFPEAAPFVFFPMPAPEFSHHNRKPEPFPVDPNTCQ